MADTETTDYVAEGLIAESYDSLFAIRKRLRSIDQFQLPVRDGVTGAQIVTFSLVLIVQVLTLALVGLPLLRFLALDHWILILLWLVGPPILASQRVLKPMAHQKSISGALRSWLRAILDDPVHRRGRGIKTPPQPWDMSIPHYQREWVMYPEFAALDVSERDITDTKTEALIGFGDVIDLQTWWDQRSHAQALDADATTTEIVKQRSDAVGSGRRRVPTVFMPESEEGE